MYSEIELGITPEDEAVGFERPKLFVDFDGVIVNTIKAVCDVYNEWWEDSTSYKFAN